MRKEIEGEVWLGLAGLASVLFGVVLLARPGIGALAVVWIIGGYSLLFGMLLVALGLGVKAPLEATRQKCQSRAEQDQSPRFRDLNRLKSLCRGY